ncbi:4948_t:CDS:2, partial [Acaulospora morrowiae]
NDCLNLSDMPTTRLRSRKELLNLARDHILAAQQEKEMKAWEGVQPIIIAEMFHSKPTSDHGKVAGKIAFLTCAWNNRLFGFDRENHIVSPNSYFTADVSIRPLDLPPSPAGLKLNSDGGAYPTIVVEVGKSEFLSSLHSLSTYYFSPRTNIQICLTIKLFPICQDGTMAMPALRYLRTNQNQTVPDVVISFGTAPLNRSAINFLLNNMGVPSVDITGIGFAATICNAPSIPNYQLHIPAVELFNGSPSGVPAKAINSSIWIYRNCKI